MLPEEKRIKGLAGSEELKPGIQYDEWEVFPESFSRCEYCGLRFNNRQLYYLDDNNKDNNNDNNDKDNNDNDNNDKEKKIVTAVKLCYNCLVIIASEHWRRNWK
jgi:hypothetical protein